MRTDGAINGLSLIVGERMEFCLTLYCALLGRLPDPEALRHFANVEDDAKARIAEVKRTLASEEFSRNPLKCVVSTRAKPPDLQDPTLRMSNFLTYVMPQLHTLILQQQDLIEIKSDEIGGLIQEILVETATDNLFHTAPAPSRTGTIDNERLEELGRELETLKTYVQWELPKLLLRQINHTIMTNNAEFERQMLGQK